MWIYLGEQARRRRREDYTQEGLSLGGLIHRKIQYLKILILTITGVVMRYNDLFQFSQANCIHIKIVSLNKSDLYHASI